ncbi:MAG: hypothetical protein ACE5JL_11670, partial [Dehalococcoidia bacterium]
QAEVGVGEEDDGAAAVVALEGDVGAGDEADVGGVTLGDDLGGQPLLDGHGLAWGDVPGVEGAELHGDSIRPDGRGSRAEPMLSRWLL